MDDSNICLDWRVYKSILYHIFSNAVKFCDTKGKLSLEMTYEEIDVDEERQNAGDIKFGFLKTKVLNTGEGIDKQILKKLGKSFQNDQNTSVKHGVGIGLVTARELCFSLDGDFKISSSKDKGTIVDFSVLVTNKEYQKLIGDNE